MRLRSTVASIAIGLVMFCGGRLSADDIKSLLPPVGAIIGVALTPKEVQALAPNWLPADGSTVKDPKSPLNGRVLPDLRDRMLLGVDTSKDATDNKTMEGGSRRALRGTTGKMNNNDCYQPYDAECRNKFGGHAAVWDVKGSDEECCSHIHNFVVEDAPGSDELPLPPYRGVIFVVRVR